MFKQLSQHKYEQEKIEQESRFLQQQMNYYCSFDKSLKNYDGQPSSYNEYFVVFFAFPDLLRIMSEFEHQITLTIIYSDYRRTRIEIPNIGPSINWIYVHDS
ncbi:unnamed protein product, partial [Rotaria sordida]